MKRTTIHAMARGLFACSPALALAGTDALPDHETTAAIAIMGEPVTFAPGIASTDYSEVRLTLSPDGRTALWFSRNRPGGPGGYDIWIARMTADGWSNAEAAPFNSPMRDFDPAFSPDGRFVYFCSDRPGGIGGDDLYRVAVTAEGFGEAEHLGTQVNSAGNEFAPMLSPDGHRLLFSSDRPGGDGRQDLFSARHRDGRFEPAQQLPGDINTPADEFDATFLSDSATIVFARAGDFRTDRVDLFVSSPDDDCYDIGTPLASNVNSAETDTYGPMLDWSDPDRFTFSGQRANANDMDLYLVRYRRTGVGDTSSALLPECL